MLHLQRKLQYTIMATYSITINERTQIGRGMLQTMQSLASIFTVRKIKTPVEAEIPNADTLEAIRQAKAGEGVRYTSIEDFKRAMYEI